MTSFGSVNSRNEMVYVILFVLCLDVNLFCIQDGLCYFVLQLYLPNIKLPLSF